MRALGFSWLLLQGASALGWGRIARALTRAGPAGPAATAGLGVAALVWLGGWLNLFHLAFAPVLLGVLGAGAAALVWPRRAGRPDAPPADPRTRAELLLALLLIAAAVGFRLATRFPPLLFNFHDDFEKYLAHPVRMLQTGTLAAGRTSALGAETLGGQAFLQGLWLVALPLPFVDAADSLFGFALLLALAATAGLRRGGVGSGAAPAAVLLAAAVEPQMVNASALYLGAALVATAILLPAAPDGRGDAGSPLLGLVHAGAIALKTSLAPFAALHALALAALSLSRGRSLRLALRTLVCAAGWILVGLAPWLLLHSSSYLRASAAGSRSPIAPPPVPPLLSVRPLIYGGTFAHYTALATLAGLAAAWAFAFGSRSTHAGEAARARAAAAAGGGAAAVAWIVLVGAVGRAAVGAEASVRLAIPILLGAAPLCAALAAERRATLPKGVSLAPVAAALALAAAFLPALRARAWQALRSGSALAFLRPSQLRAYSAYNEAALGLAERERVRKAQQAVPPGEPLLAWIATPFHLDYRRNRIESIEVAGLVTPWAALPADARYALWQPRGYSRLTAAQLEERAASPFLYDRELAVRQFELERRLSELRARGTTLYDDGELAVFRLAPGTGF